MSYAAGKHHFEWLAQNEAYLRPVLKQTTSYILKFNRQAGYYCAITETTLDTCLHCIYPQLKVEHTSDMFYTCLY